MGVFSSKQDDKNIVTPTPKVVKKPAGVFATTSDGRMATDLPKPSPKIDVSALLRNVKAGPSSTPKTPPSIQDTQPKQIKYSKNYVPNTQIGQANPNNTTVAPKGTLYEETIKSMRPSFVKEKSDLSSDEEKDNINIDIPFTKERVLSFKNPIPKTVARNSKGVAEFVGNLPDVFAESVPRAVVSTGLALNPAAPKEIDPTTFGGEAIFGNKPIKNFTGIGNEAGVKNPFLAPFVGATYTALDLYPGTSGKAKLLTTLGKETVAKEVATVLKKEVRNLSDELIAEIAPIIAKTSDRKAIDNILNNAIKQYKDELRQSAIKPQDVTGLPTAAVSPKSGTNTQPPVFMAKNAANSNPVTTTILNRLSGRENVSKQFIMDLTNGADIKQVEKNMIRDLLEREGPNVNVPEFTKKVQTEVLPLDVKSKNINVSSVNEDDYNEFFDAPDTKYESIVLPDKLRGKIKDYSENVYESPVPTAAGKAHFPESKNYFGHTRIEDLPDNTTRRVIEVQSDLYQKGNLQAEAKLGLIPESRYQELNKLAQYTNPTAHFRMVREEIKRAAQDGKDKLLFPTGETAMKIEGLGENQNWFDDDKYQSLLKNGIPEGMGGMQAVRTHARLDVGDLSVGKIIKQGVEGRDWVITDMLGDGKFKAVPKRSYDQHQINIKNAPEKSSTSLSVSDYEQELNAVKETFDISGKVDTNNPIYKFYEKDLNRYLTSKHDAKLVTDKQGVSWYEVPVKKEAADQPVIAFKAEPKLSFTEDTPIADAKKMFSKMFDPDEVELMTGKRIDQYANGQKMTKDVVGFFTTRNEASDLIAIVERKGKISKDTLYHEAMHAYMSKFVSREERDSVIDYIIKNKKAEFEQYDKAFYNSDVDLAHEWLADDFARYVQGKKVDEKLKPLFERMYEKVKQWVTGVKKIEENNPSEFKGLYERVLNKDRSYVTPKQVKLQIRSQLKVAGKKLPKDLEEKAMYVEAKAFALENHPAKDLAKYAATRGEFAGQLPEVTGKGSTFGKKGDKIIQDLTNDYYEYPEDARRGYEDYVAKQKELAKLKKELKQQIYSYEAKTYLANKAAALKEAEVKATKEFVAAKPERKSLPSLTPKKVEVVEPKKPNYTPEKRQEFTDALDAATKLAAEKRDYAIRVREIVKEANRPFVRGNTIRDAIKRALNPINYTDKKTKDLFVEWKKKLLVSKELANQDLKLISKLPEKDGLKTIHAYEAGRSTPHRDQIQKAFDNLLKEANERGLNVERRENYIPHVYKESPAEIKNLIGVRMAEKGIDQGTIKDYLDGVGSLSPEQAKSLKLKPSFTKERSFDTYTAASEYGLHPKYEHPAQLVSYYRHEMEKTFANSEFMKKLELDGKILPAGIAPRTWEEIRLNYGGQRWFADKRFAQVINGQIVDVDNLGPLPLVIKKFAGVSKFTQDIALSAGVPTSNINFFSTGQLIKELTSGNFKAVSPYLRANFTGPSLKFFERKGSVIKSMAGQGIDLGNRIGNYADVYSGLSKKFRDRDIRGLLGGAFDKLFNEKTFGSFMPQLYIGTFESALKKGIKKGMDRATAETFAGNVVKKFMGLIEDSGRSELMKDGLSAAFFAPKFRESLINTLVNTGKSFTTQWKNPAFYKNRRLIAGMVLTYAGYDTLNRKLNNGQAMINNEPGREMALRVPLPNGDVVYVEFMPSFLSFARSMFLGTKNLAQGNFDVAQQKFGSVFSMPIKISNELLTNQDYFGRPIYNNDDPTKDKILKMAGYVGLQVNHPYIEELAKQSGITQPTIKKLLNVPDEKPPLYQTISTMFEFPLKFSSMSKLNQNEEAAANRIISDERKDRRNLFQPQFDEIQSLMKEGKEEEAQKKLDDLSDYDYGTYKDIIATQTAQTTKQAKTEFLPKYNAILEQKFAGNIPVAEEMLANLTDEEYELYSQMVEQYGGRTTKMIIDGKQKPKFGDNSKTDDDSLIKTVFTYAHAIGVDPVVAFDRIFSGQKIRRVDNGAIIVERMSMEESQAIKKKEGKDNKDYKLDHTISLQLGGPDTEDNLKIVPTDVWETYTPVENYLGKLLRNDKINKKEAQRVIVEFKNGQIRADEIYQQYK